MAEFRLDSVGPSSISKSPLNSKPLGNLNAKEPSTDFLDTLKGMLGEVNSMQVKADEAAQKFAAGEQIQLHEVMMAMEKADVAIRTVTAVRNKMVEAYQEIMRMPV